MFGLGKNQTNNTGNSIDLGMRTMKSDLKSPYEEFHEKVEMPEIINHEEPQIKKTSQLAVPIPQNLPVAEIKPAVKNSAIPESSIQGANVKFNENFKKNEFHSNETEPAEKKEYNKPKINYPKPENTNNDQSSIYDRNFPEIPDKVRQEINNQYNDHSKKSAGGGINKLLLSLTVIVFIMTIGSGLYYYFYIIDSGQEPDIAEVESQDNNIQSDPTVEPEMEPEIETEPQTPTALSESTFITIGEQGLSASISTLPITVEGSFYQLTDQEDPISSPVKQNIILGVNLGEAETNLQNGWLFLAKDESETIKTALVYSLSDTINIHETVAGLEPDLPTKLSGMFISASPPTVSNIAVFKDSETRQGVRYFNFIPGNPSSSIDWTIIDIDGVSYLIFANSQATMSQVLSALSR